MTPAVESVKRYDIYMHSDEVQFLRQCSDGEYVRWSDYDALLAERDRIASDRDAKTARMWELGKECDALTQRVERLRRDVQIAVDLLMAFNKDAHRRNPLAVTAIDVFLAERALTHAGKKA